MQSQKKQNRHRFVDVERLTRNDPKKKNIGTQGEQELKAPGGRSTQWNLFHLGNCDIKLKRYVKIYVDL